MTSVLAMETMKNPTIQDGGIRGKYLALFSPNTELTALVRANDWLKTSILEGNMTKIFIWKDSVDKDKFGIQMPKTQFHSYTMWATYIDVYCYNCGKLCAMSNTVQIDGRYYCHNCR